MKDRILRKVTTLKKEKTSYYTSNIFGIQDSISNIEENEHAIAFVFLDKTVKRVQFAANDGDSLKEVLERMPVPSGIEYIGNELDEITKKAIVDAGYRFEGDYVRRIIKNLKDDIYVNIPDKFKGVDCESNYRYATQEDAEAIYKMLYETFSPFTSHLVNMEELKEQIDKREVVVAPPEGPITGLLTFWYQGRKLYMEHAINRGESVNMHSMYFSVLEKAAKDGINVCDTWVEINNIPSMKFGNRYGFVNERLHNFAFVKE